jgi:glycosyltransferase involved in cell wall biosynthesis
MRPLSFSIVTPSFNQGVFIADALLSVAMQSGNNVEHWVIDGGSNDGTVDILRSYSEHGGKHLRWISEPDCGQSEALNKGFTRASGDIVGWLNSDDRYRDGCFDRVAKVFEENPEVDIVYGDYTWMDAGGRIFRLRREIEFSRFILLYHRVLYIPTTATFFRRRVFEQGGRLDQAWQYAMDFAFFLELMERGYRFLHVPALLADFRFQPGSKTCTASDKQLKEIELILRMHSPVVSRMRGRGAQQLTTAFLRICAGALRYSEKLVRGYYFDQFRVAGLNS